ncbi:MAG TPA: excinuclease ABC subunit UvrC [Candidatus Dojkabacteria bacterium]|nr:excinuclease ABC subunit UvrC [Candidatus Dojkabacteria bacterium]HOR06089.1 excinuclease ABC subunit UvrC [Candidatus Dojkabacteria bacterium]
MVKEILNKPGVYKFLDKNKKVLYVGKAVNLKQRVSSYFNGNLNDRPWVAKMIPLVRDIETVVTENELEALVLESALIKKYKPKYNSDLKDDKSYSWIHISTNEEFPKLKVVRNKDIKNIKSGRLFGPYPSGSSVKRVFTYLRKIYPFCTCKKAKKECLYFHLGLCPGPYQGHISREDYRKNIDGIIKFLTGKKSSFVKKLEGEMKTYSQNKQYEKAAELRDKIADLKYLGSSLTGDFFEDEKSYELRKDSLYKKVFSELRKELKLTKLERIECYDISNIQGQEAYGSMVVNENGEIKNNEYRIFKIKESNTPNDPMMLKEVLTRRFKNEKMSKHPDVVLIDGGKGQLSVVASAVPNGVLLLGISKGKRLKRKGFKPKDEFWMHREGETDRVYIRNEKLLINLRDEAHRFSITYHKKARIKKGLRSQLLKIEGIGESRAKKLLMKFKSMENIKNAKLEEIDSVIKNKKVSEEVIKSLST